MSILASRPLESVKGDDSNVQFTKESMTIPLNGENWKTFLKAREIYNMDGQLDAEYLPKICGMSDSERETLQSTIDSVRRRILLDAKKSKQLIEKGVDGKRQIRIFIPQSDTAWRKILMDEVGQSFGSEFAQLLVSVDALGTNQNAYWIFLGFLEEPQEYRITEDLEIRIESFPKGDLHKTGNSIGVQVGPKPDWLKALLD